MSRIVTLFLAILLALPAGTEEPRPLLLASTTSTENTGLFDAILPDFEKQTGIPVRVVAVGTGQALLLARSGDADVLLVHDRASEDRFIKEGYGVERFDVMANDFVVVGPPDDPAAIRGEPDIARALGRIAASESRFVSRGDDSGTHKAEMRQWRAAGIDPLAASGRWYLELGSGMGATLNTAAAMGAYALADRGTWLAFRNRGDLDLVVEGDPRLANPYSVIAVNPARHPHVNARAAERFIEWIRSPPAQRAIGAFRVGGESLFVPSASPPG